MRFRFPALFLATALAFTMFCGQARAMQAADPSTLITQLVSQAINVIVDKSSSEDQREQKFRSLLQSGFDIPRISRFVRAFSRVNLSRAQLPMWVAVE